MPDPLALPEGYAERPLALADSAAVTAVMAAEQLAATGEVVIEEADILADWQRPSYDVRAGTVGVVSTDGTLVAYAECSGGSRADASVHPDHTGKGIGTALAGWAVARAAELGEPVIGMPNPRGSLGDRLLASLGWFVRWESWVLELPADADVPRRPLPPAYTLRQATEADLPMCWTVVEDAFLEWSEREREPFEDWRASVTGRPGFEPWNLRVVTDPAGEVVAVALVLLADDGREGYVDRLATREDHRGLGLAQALLADGFAVARAHGATRSTLSTDSRTGALSLYQRVGMTVTQTWVHRAQRTR